MKKIIDGLKDGGGKFIGFDATGERMYSVSNGENVLLWGVMIAATITGVAALAAGIAFFLNH